MTSCRFKNSSEQQVAGSEGLSFPSMLTTHYSLLITGAFAQKSLAKTNLCELFE